MLQKEQSKLLTAKLISFQISLLRGTQSQTPHRLLTTYKGVSVIFPFNVRHPLNAIELAKFYPSCAINVTTVPHERRTNNNFKGKTPWRRNLEYDNPAFHCLLKLVSYNTRERSKGSYVSS